MKALAIGMILALAASSAATACEWNKKMTMAEAPITISAPAKVTVAAADVPVDLWLVPYLS